MARTHELTIQIDKELGRYWAKFALKGMLGKPESFGGDSPIAAIRHGLDLIERAAKNQKKLGRPFKGSRIAALASRKADPK